MKHEAFVKIEDAYLLEVSMLSHLKEMALQCHQFNQLPYKHCASSYGSHVSKCVCVSVYIINEKLIVFTAVIMKNDILEM